MKITVTLSALALALAPTLALAQGCHDKAKDETASSCMPGHGWDAATQACVPTPSS
jgi:hypothetical protein